ncbi:hypothetical protein DLAC_09278 [Tieghemostelium lacteum]|uniref:FNIP repeat-containing protein n=1 Tax=Tieghemostelium lacteum TaxID=361077 RepID=A0A151Z9P6_TIELA|nr:hypothetical protein DLAC_09278 [Tieghemostelium lacteum]|eukprot:KYQ90645.1 hypothetical protein DLAC_09278 [Tieghemostelium lacteum]
MENEKRKRINSTNTKTQNNSNSKDIDNLFYDIWRTPKIRNSISGNVLFGQTINISICYLNRYHKELSKIDSKTYRFNIEFTITKQEDAQALLNSPNKGLINRLVIKMFSIGFKIPSTVRIVDIKPPHFDDKIFTLQKGNIPEGVETLILRCLKQPIESSLFPSTLIDLRFECYIIIPKNRSTLHQISIISQFKLTERSLPSSLLRLSMPTYEHDITKGILPKGLKELRLGIAGSYYGFCKTIEEGSLPDSIETLELVSPGHNLDEIKYRCSRLPQSLQHLIMDGQLPLNIRKFKSMLAKLPARQLKSFKLVNALASHGDSDLPITEVYYQTNITEVFDIAPKCQKLVFQSYHENLGSHSLDKPSLTDIDMGDFKGIISQHAFPPNLKRLRMDSYHRAFPMGVLPSRLEFLSLSKFNFTLKKIPMGSLTELNIEKSLQPIAVGLLPRTLKKLSLNCRGVPTKGIIPDSVTDLTLWCGLDETAYIPTSIVKLNIPYIQVVSANKIDYLPDGFTIPASVFDLTIRRSFPRTKVGFIPNSVYRLSLSDSKGISNGVIPNSVGDLHLVHCDFESPFTLTNLHTLRFDKISTNMSFIPKSVKVLQSSTNITLPVRAENVSYDFIMYTGSEKKTFIYYSTFPEPEEQCIENNNNNNNNNNNENDIEVDQDEENRVKKKLRLDKKQYELEQQEELEHEFEDAEE